MWETSGPEPGRVRITYEGVAYDERCVKDVFRAVVARYARLGLRLGGDWETPLWQALAKAYPRHVHRVGKPGKARCGVSVVGLVSFVNFIRKRRKDKRLVAPALAHARAAVCQGCPERRSVGTCAVCKEALKLMVKPPEKVNAPMACCACGCYLPLKVWLPREQLGGVEEFPFWEHCWMRSESTQE